MQSAIGLLKNGRSSRSQMFKVGVLKELAIFTGKHLCLSLFLIMLQAWRYATLLKRDSYTGLLLWIQRNLQERSLFYRTPVVAVSEIAILKGYFFCRISQPISCQWSLLIPPENIRKREVFWCFQGVSKEICGMKWVNADKPWQRPKYISKKWLWWLVLVSDHLQINSTSNNKWN